MPQEMASASVREVVGETAPGESAPDSPHSHPGTEPQSTPFGHLPGKGIHRRRRLQIPTAGCRGVARKLEWLRAGGAGRDRHSTGAPSQS